MAHSSTSPSHLKKTQTVHFRATLQTAEIVILFFLVVLGVTVLVVLVLLQTKDLKCATHLLSEKFRNMSEEKKTIIRDLGFGGLIHIPPLRVHHQILRELANSFKLGENRLKTGYDSFKVRQKTIGAVLGINASGDLFPHKVIYKDLSEDDKQIFRRFQDGVPVTNDNKQNLTCAPGPNFRDGHNNRAELGRACFEFYHQGHNRLQAEKKKAIDDCLFSLMIIYFHLSKNKDKKRTERPPEPWIANWSKEQLESKKRKKNQEDSDSESELTDESEIGTEDLDEFLRKNNEKSAAQGEKEADLRSTEGHYVSSETLSLVEESASELAEENIMVVREETPFEALAISDSSLSTTVPTTTMPEVEQTPETENEPTPLLQIEETTQSNPTPEDTTALMMMARTASYVPKIDSMSSFNLGLTDSSQEKTATQEGASTQDGDRAKTPETPKLLEQLGDLVQKIASGEVTIKEKSPQIPKESGAESFEKFETPVRTNENSSDMKEKCYLWAIRVKTYADGLTNEFDNIVSAMCFILNQQKIKRFQEEVYCPPDIVNMAIANHPQGVFLQPKNNKPFRVEDYPMFIPFLDHKKLASHRYHWWLWFADTRKRKFYIVDPYHTKSPSDERTALNTFIYMLGAPLKSRDKDKEIVPPYLHISGQKTSYHYTIYVMKWLEIFEPANIKRRKYEWDNWTQVDHFRVEYASRILFHDMNLDKAEAIRKSNVIRLSKPSSLLLSPYCQIDSKDVDTD
ncbi:hypothetical protein Ahy_B06g082121 [Arachis hypogaea]|uniref:Ubiquitin-like protease family profile domain-containing protein n=1 Tax=Arachis hypogaea TaxID=3818 RepID=A0A444YMY3_ARAHY|nr:hypothetical protein Ahy_B06g082121 [Arachis hypogaea]